MILRIFRSDEKGRFGTIEVSDDLMFFSVEKPWKDNKPFESCIPEGDYQLVPHNSKKYGDVLAIVGGTVSHYKDPEYERYACLLHAANWPKDVEGCIGLGDNYIADKNMVTNSVQSMKDFYEVVSPYETHNLTIENAEYLKD